MENKRIMSIVPVINQSLEKAYSYLEQGEWDNARAVLLDLSKDDRCKNNPYLFVGKILENNQLPTIDSLPYCPGELKKESGFNSAYKNADVDLKLQLDCYVLQNKAYRDLANFKVPLEPSQKVKELFALIKYNFYVEKSLEENLTADEYLHVRQALLQMDYLESKKYADICYEKSNAAKIKEKTSKEEEQKLKIYSSARDLVLNSGDKIAEYETAKTMLESMVDYRDSKELIQQCNQKIKKIRTSNTIFVLLSAIIFIASIVLFSGDILMSVLVCEVIVAGLGYYVGKATGNPLKFMFVGLIIGLLFGLLLGWIMGIELYDTGDACGVCGGSGVFLDKICPACHGWGSK